MTSIFTQPQKIPEPPAVNPASQKLEGNAEQDGAATPFSTTLPRVHFDTRVLTREEEVNLGRSIRDAKAEGNTNLACELIQRFTMHNYGLIHAIAEQYSTGGLAREDLVQIGVIGCQHAVQRWNPELGVKFSSYAVWPIRRAINRGLSNGGHLIRVPPSSGSIIAMLFSATEKIDIAEVAEKTNTSKRTVSAVIEVRKHRPQSLNDSSMGFVLNKPDLSPPTLETLEHNEQLDLLRAALEKMDSRTRDALELRFGLKDGVPKTLQECGEALGVTKEGARVICDRGIKKLKQLLNAPE
jgi:RNA polymerase sigma factor (sigma-70 family)